MKIIKVVFALFSTGFLLYILGPAPKKPIYADNLSPIPSIADGLENYIINDEKKYAPIRPGNEAQIVWFDDSLKNKTKYSIVYLHGFSASHEEGNPVHRNIAKKYGMNLYLSRLADHGRLKDKSLSNFTAEQAWSDALEAYHIGKSLGDKVILMSTSTGGTLSLMLTSRYKDVYAQILMSPNIALKDPSAFILNNPWGLQIARKVIGSENRVIHNATPEYAKYWDTAYRIEALVELEELVESSMSTSNFRKITQPTLMLYYYEDEDHQDPVVRVDAMKKMFNEISTPSELKIDKPIPNAKGHILASPIKSKDIETVQSEINEFFRNQLKLTSK